MGGMDKEGWCYNFFIKSQSAAVFFLLAGRIHACPPVSTLLRTRGRPQTIGRFFVS